MSCSRLSLLSGASVEMTLERALLTLSDLAGKFGKFRGLVADLGVGLGGAALSPAGSRGTTCSLPDLVSLLESSGSP